MSALGRVVRSGVSRRWVQTVVMTLAAAAAATAGVLGGGLLVASNAPFEHAFARQHGAHLTAQFDASKVTSAQLTAAARTAGATASAGPFPTTQVSFVDPAPADVGGGGALPPMTVAGRAHPDSSVDAVVLTAGRWATRPGEIVISASGHYFFPTGTTLAVAEPAGGTKLTIVGQARSVSGTADAWMTPSGLAALHPRVTGFQMMYRFAHAQTGTQVTADRKAVAAALPAHALIGSQSWLVVKVEANRRTAIYVPFLLAFGALSLVLAVLIVGTVVAGAVGSATRRIGVLKALGFTPGQVVRAYLVQALLPTSVGVLIGLVAGNALAVPALAKTQRLYGAATLTVAPWVDVAVLVGILAVVAATAAVAAGRAGRLRAVEAIAARGAQSAGRGRYAAQVATRLPVPRAVGLGLARPFGAPARAVAMIVAIAFGTTAVTLAIGLAATLSRTQVAAEHSAADVIVSTDDEPNGGPAKPSTADPARVTAALDAQPGTAGYFGLTSDQGTVAGMSGSAQISAFTRNPSWAGYELVSGRWFARSGEAVVASELLRAADKAVGDTLTVTSGGVTRQLRIVGVAFDPNDDGYHVLTQALPGMHPSSWEVALTDGTSPATYVSGLAAKLKGLGLSVHVNQSRGPADLVVIVDALAGFLTVLLVTVAGLGVLNSVVLDVRDRVHDIGIQKALGLTPRQTIAGVLASVGPVGLVGGVIGVPAGLVLHGILVPAMGRGAGTQLPAVALTVYRPIELVVLAFGGLVIAGAGALLPAGWAAKTRTATALRTE